MSKKKGDHLFDLKGNQGKTLEAVKERFDTHTALDESHIKTTVDGDHGRIEERVYKVFPADEIRDLKEWLVLKAVAIVESKTQKSKGEISSEKRFYITSLPLDVAKIARAIRGHWGGRKLTSLGFRCANE